LLEILAWAIVFARYTELSDRNCEGDDRRTSAADADRAGRRAQVVEALADAVTTIDRVPPVHIGSMACVPPPPAPWPMT
jgi:predicted nuclease with TOPRIM domain